MMPPISGMHANAAATLEGKPVDVDFGPSSGPGLGEGGGGIGSWSGMIYIHRMQNVLSSILPRSAGFWLSLAEEPQYHALHEQNSPSPRRSRLHPDRVACRNRDPRHLGRTRSSS